MQTSYRFSAPGRTEISGNHTDHQHGCVLAAAVDLETTAEVTLRPDSIIRVASEGYAPVEIDLNDLSVHAEEKNTTAALVRGVAAAFTQRGCKLHGFDAAVRSTVLPGSGLSSSAAFEVLIGTICNELFFDKKCSAIEIAQIGQYAENVYFGKPCGLMDQMASSVGGLVFIDFADPAHPAVRQAAFDFAHCGYTLCTLDSGADHADLTDEYAAIPEEMRRVARVFGKDVLREVDEAEFYAKLKAAREAAGDRLLIAEDLGDVTDDVRDLIRYSGFPGMGVLQFAFFGDPKSPHLPYNYPENLVAYTGTHDNNTLLGYMWEQDEATRRRILAYCNYTGEKWDACYDHVLKTMLASHAGLVIFPLQDLLHYGSDCRMNTPGRAEGNWAWRTTEEQLAGIDWRRWHEWLELYGRI